MTQDLSAAPAAVQTTPPAIGEYWPGQGGIYVGEAVEDADYPQGYLVLALATSQERFTHKQATAWAEKQDADGHVDFRLPTRFESALIYANARQHVDIERWHWTGTLSGGSHAWFQLFDHGYQYPDHVDDNYCARAVRRFVL